MIQELQELRQKRIKGFLKTIPETLHFHPTKTYGEKYRKYSLISYIPTNKQIIIMPMAGKKVTASGIEVIEFDQDNLIDKRTDNSSYVGMIISAAPDAYMHHIHGDENPIPFKPGDLCTYNKVRDTYIEFGGKKLIIVASFDCWGIIPDNLYYNYQFELKGDVFQNIRHRVINPEDLKKINEKKITDKYKG